MALFDKPLKLFFVIDKSLLDRNPQLKLEEMTGQIYTITTTIDQANEYICNLIISDRYDHYSQWCELRGISPDDGSSKEDYLLAINPNIYEFYTVYSLEFPRESIACIMRMFFYCIPLDCSFTTDVEFERFKKLAAIYDQVVEPIEETPEVTA